MITKQQRNNYPVLKMAKMLNEHDFEECYKSWRAFVKKSNSRGIMLKLDKFKEKLKNEKVNKRRIQRTKN